MKCLRPKPYVHIRFKPAGKRARWYWAIKLGPQTFKRVLKDGDECIKEHVRADGVSVCTEELLVGVPDEERVAVMNLHYAKLEESHGRSITG